MLLSRQAPRRDFHKHFSLASARRDTNPPSNPQSAPAPSPLQDRAQARNATSRAPHLSLITLAPPAPPRPPTPAPPPPRCPPSTKHLKPRVDTDGEGRGSPARLCTTAVRRLWERVGTPPRVAEEFPRHTNRHCPPHPPRLTRHSRAHPPRLTCHPRAPASCRDDSAHPLPPWACRKQRYKRPSYGGFWPCVCDRRAYSACVSEQW